MALRERWTGRFGFVMATAGFAVGLANIWRFPYVVGQNGGAAFLIAYLVFAVLIGIPLLTAETSLGRRAQRSPVAGMARLVGARSPWMAFPWLGISTTFVIVANYLVLLSWIGGYLVLLLLGRLPSGTPDAIAGAFNAYIATPAPVLLGSGALMLTCGLLVARGLTGGLERVARVAMPALLVTLLLLAARSLTLRGAAEGISWYLQPDFSRLGPGALLTAMGQAFFSIGVGLASAFGMASYLDPDTSDIPGNAVLVAGCDTAVAVLAGFVIFPALFAFGMEPDSGPTLLFISMPALFAQMPAGALFGAVFLALLLVAGITSMIAALQVMAAVARDTFGWSRPVAAVSLAWFAMSVPVALAKGPLSHIRVGGLDLFDALDMTVGVYLVPLGGLVLALYVATSVNWETFMADTNRGSGLVRVTAAWRPFLKLLIPAALTLVFLGGLGLL